MSEKKSKRVWLDTYCFVAQDHKCGNWCALFDLTRKQCVFWDLVQIGASIDESLRAMNGG